MEGDLEEFMENRGKNNLHMVETNWDEIEKDQNTPVETSEMDCGDCWDLSGRSDYILCIYAA